MTVNEVLKLLTEKPKLLRRPILIDRNKLVIGYNPGELMKLTKKNGTSICIIRENEDPLIKIYQLIFVLRLRTGLAGFEPTITESKSIALPLGYSPSDVITVCASGADLYIQRNLNGGDP